jgi:predicted CoA-binding protein
MVRTLIQYEHEVVPVGFREGKIENVEIVIGQPEIKDVDTISLYLGPRNQPPFYDYIIGLSPKRIIFNPGTYNPELFHLANKNGIETVINCALIMLNRGIY